MKKLLKAFGKQRAEERRAELYRNLIRHSAKIGGQLFGPVPAGSRREFFCLDEHTWVWHEEWTDQNGQYQIKTTRYDVRPSGIVKNQDGQPSRYINLEEARNLRKAILMYNQQIHAEFGHLV